MKKLTVFLLLTLALLTACAGGPPLQGTTDGYYNGDHFSWTDYDNDVHILGAYSIGLTTSELLYTQGHFTKLESTLMGVMLAGGIGTVKETMHDAWCSKTDIKAWWIGAIGSGVTFNLINLKW